MPMAWSSWRNLSTSLYACVYWCLTMSSHQRWRTSASRSERWCVLSRLCRVLGVAVFCSKRRSRSKTSWSGRSVSSTSSLSFCFRFQGLRFTRTHFETSALTCCVNPHSTRSWRSPGRGFPVPTHAGPGVPARRLLGRGGSRSATRRPAKGLSGSSALTAAVSLNSLCGSETQVFRWPSRRERNFPNGVSSGNELDAIKLTFFSAPSGLRGAGRWPPGGEAASAWKANSELCPRVAGANALSLSAAGGALARPLDSPSSRTKRLVEFKKGTIPFQK